MIKDGLYDKAKLVPSPNKGGFIKPRLIIVHDTAGGLDAAGSVAWLRNPQAKASAHFVVARDGAVTQLVSCNLRAWHAGVSSYNGVPNVNDYSIGIEIVNPGILTADGAKSARASFGKVFSRKAYSIQELPVQYGFINGLDNRPSHPAGLWMPYTQAQLDAVLALCLDLKSAYGISAVAPHWYISPGRKIDTNPLFPLRWLQGKLEGRTTVADNPAPATVVLQELVPVPLPPDPLTVPITYVVPFGHGKLREWPSFNASNVITVSDGHGPFKVVGEGEYFIEGDVDDELGNTRLPWYKVEFHETEGGEVNIGFILKANAKVA